MECIVDWMAALGLRQEQTRSPLYGTGPQKLRKCRITAQGLDLGLIRHSNSADASPTLHVPPRLRLAPGAALAAVGRGALEVPTDPAGRGPADPIEPFPDRDQADDEDDAGGDPERVVGHGSGLLLR